MVSTAKSRSRSAIAAAIRLRFGRVDRLGFAGIDEAETTGTGTALPEQHERRSAFVPAFEDVRTSRLFAHRDEVEVATDLLEPVVLRAGVEFHRASSRVCAPYRKTAGDAGLGQPPFEPNGNTAVGPCGVIG